MPRRQIFALAFPVLVILVAACSGFQGPPATSEPPQPVAPDFTSGGQPKPHGQILFTSERAGNSEIYLMSANGGEAVNLTLDPAWDYSASWSPDGKRVAFLSDRTGKAEVFAMDADGSNLLQLTDNREGWGWWPPVTWSPDGGRLLVTRSLTYSDTWSQAQIQVVEVDGSGWRSLYPQQSMAHNDWTGEWLPDGNQVDFLGGRYTSRAVFTVPAMGGAPTGLFVRGSESVIAFAGSPIGDELAVVTYSPDQSLTYHTSLHRILRAGLKEMAVPDAARLDAFGDFILAWSPAGDRIAFPATELHGYRELWVWFVTSPGDLDENLVAMTDLGGVFGHLSWSPDGQWVAFTAKGNGDDEIYIVRVGLEPATAGTTPLLRLASSEGRDYDPAWRP